jgi:ribonuclease HI
MILVFTDGACIKNGKPGARASYAVYFPEIPHLTEAALLDGPKQSNNRAEYMGVIRAMEIYLNLETSEDLHIYTDSMLLYNTVTKWMANWKRKGWKKAGGSEEVLNLDLVLKLDELYDASRMTLHHIEAHTKNTDIYSEGNRVADSLCTKLLKAL